MIYIRREAEEIHQGFNFYPRNDEGSVGCQMLFGRLRIEARWSRRTGRFQIGMWLRTYAKLPKEELVYIPGYTEELTKLYEDWVGKPYSEWCHDSELEKQRVWEQKERNRIRDELRKSSPK
jgi:hypothetical protein